MFVRKCQFDVWLRSFYVQFSQSTRRYAWLLRRPAFLSPLTVKRTLIDRILLRYKFLPYKLEQGFVTFVTF